MLYLFPAIILGLQIIRNNKILWAIIFGLFSLYILIAIFVVVSDLVERGKNHPKAITLDLKDLLMMITIFFILGFVDWIIYCLRPKRVL